MQAEKAWGPRLPKQHAQHTFCGSVLLSGNLTLLGMALPFQLSITYEPTSSAPGEAESSCSPYPRAAASRSDFAFST